MIDNRPAAGAALIMLSGEYDIARQDELNVLLEPAYSSSEVTLDMNAVTYIDSTALTCLIRLHKRLRENGDGRVRMIGARRNVRRILELTKLDLVFDLANEP